MSPKLDPLFKHGWKAQNQIIRLDGREWNDCRLTIKREDRVDEVISGNKFRKLRYNLIEAIQTGKDTLFTFGGAYSNHIAAVARAARLCNMKSTGVIRGDELHANSNPTLRYADSQGMQLHFVDRDHYRNRDDNQLLNELAIDPERTYLLPEGGTNELAVKGCKEILSGEDLSFDYICVAVGTGGTMAGLVRSATEDRVIGFSVLNGTHQREIVGNFTKKGFAINDHYNFNGYGKIDDELLRFINNFKRAYGVPLDPIYTGKLLFGVLDMIRQGEFGESANILAIHTGGLQGIEGMNQKLKRLNRPQIL